MQSLAAEASLGESTGPVARPSTAARTPEPAAQVYVRTLVIPSEGSAPSGGVAGLKQGVRWRRLDSANQAARIRRLRR
jgi:hypothetical protein